jgi:acetylornithine deacetylase/succinyl-diaminopimelate desuccinylase-like protein
MPTAAEDEVVDLCRDLLRIDTSNFGDSSGPGERAAAEYVAAKLSDVGLESRIVESEPGRASVLSRVEGTDSSRPPLLIHGHLDVVPAQKEDWSVDPFAGEIRDDCLWGRGAVDMKDMDAMTLAVIRDLVRSGRKPPRDLVLAFVADEEAGGGLGASYLVNNHADHFADCTEAISEVGGFSITLAADQRLYPVQCAEKGMSWLKLTASGTAGHGSYISPDNAVTRLAEAVVRIGNHEFPLRLTETVRAFLLEVAEALGIELDVDDPEATVSKLGNLGRLVGATLRNTANPTVLNAGYKHNVVPQFAEALVDGRFLPGYEEEFVAEIDALLGPDVKREFVHRDVALEVPFSGPLVDAMCAALTAEDPGGKPVPFCISGGTDAKSFSRLGIVGYGFSPLQLPPELDFVGMFHGIDERVPLEALKFGCRVLDRFLATC